MFFNNRFKRFSYFILNLLFALQLASKESCHAELKVENRKSSALAPPVETSYEIKRLWEIKDTRIMLERYFKERLFLFDPEFADAFVGEVDFLLSKNLSEEAFHLNLKNFIAPHRERILKNWDPYDRQRADTTALNIADDLYPAPKSLVDIGAGDGEITRRLAKLWGLSREDTIAVEIVDRYDNENFVMVRPENNFRTIPLPANSYEAANLNMVLHHAEDPEALVREAFRILRPGAKLSVKEHNASSNELKLFGAMLDKLLYRVIRDIPDVPIRETGYRSTAHWESVFKEAGFSIEKVTPSIGNTGEINPVNPVRFVLQKPL